MRSATSGPPRQPVQRADVGRGRRDRVEQPRERRVRVLAPAEREQRVERVRRVAHPAEAVVPVRVAAQPLGQRRRRRRRDAAVRLVRQQLQRERRTRDGVAPRAVVARGRGSTCARPPPSRRGGARSRRARDAAAARPPPRRARAARALLREPSQRRPIGTERQQLDVRPARRRRTESGRRAPTESGLHPRVPRCGARARTTAADRARAA